MAQPVMIFFFHPRPVVPTFCGERPRFSSRAHRSVGHDKLGLPKSSNGETNLSSSSGITEAHLPSSDYRASPPLGDHGNSTSSCARTHSVPRSVPLTLRNGCPAHSSFLHTELNELCLLYPTTLRLHAMNTSQTTRSTMPPTTTPQG